MSTSKPKANARVTHDLAMSEYRSWLIAAEQKSQESFDKAVLTLSGGALGVSFVFLKDVVGENPIQSHHLLLYSWMSWGLSVILTLGSFYCSHLALRNAIRQVDDGSIHQKPAGGGWARVTEALNGAGAVLFFVGVCFITAFAHVNLPTRGAAHAIQAPITAPPATQSAPAAAPTSAAVTTNSEPRVHPASTPAAATDEEVKSN